MLRTHMDGRLHVGRLPVVAGDLHVDLQGVQATYARRQVRGCVLPLGGWQQGCKCAGGGSLLRQAGWC